MAQVIIKLEDGNSILLRGATDCWEWCEQVNVKGEMVWRAEKYYAQLDTALKAIAGRKVRMSDAKTLQQLQETIKRVHTELTEVYGTIPIDTSAADADRKKGDWKQQDLFEGVLPPSKGKKARKGA